MFVDHSSVQSRCNGTARVMWASSTMGTRSRRLRRIRAPPGTVSSLITTFSKSTDRTASDSRFQISFFGLHRPLRMAGSSVRGDRWQLKITPIRGENLPWPPPHGPCMTVPVFCECILFVINFLVFLFVVQCLLTVILAKGGQAHSGRSRADGHPDYHAWKALWSHGQMVSLISMLF